MKIVYAGTPDFAVAPLRAIVEAGYTVAAVITQKDKPVGRKGILTPPPVKTFALGHGIPVLQFDKIRNEAEAVKTLGADVMITCAFGQILSAEILDLFPLGVWNIHASLLPKYRGAAPIQQAVIDGEKYTGITVMKTEVGLDTGDILLVKRTEILPSETAGELSDRLSVLGAEAIKESLPLIESGSPALLLQDNAQATVVKKITKEQGKIDWTKKGVEIVDLVRGMNPAPVAFTTLDGQNINVYLASFMEYREYRGDEVCGTVLSIPKKLVVKCSDGGVVLEEVQFAGGKKIRGADAINGRKIQAGQVLQ
jgi:methionyl-tRNA formyltransferase